MTTAPDPEHRVTRARDDSDEPEQFVAGQTSPEIEADRGDDQECRAVKDDPLTRRPGFDLTAPLSPHEIDEECDGEEERDPEQRRDRQERRVLVEDDHDERDQPDDQKTTERGPVGKELAQLRRSCRRGLRARLPTG